MKDSSMTWIEFSVVRFIRFNTQPQQEKHPEAIAIQPGRRRTVKSVRPDQLRDSEMMAPRSMMPQSLPTPVNRTSLPGNFGLSLAPSKLPMPTHKMSCSDAHNVTEAVRSTSSGEPAESLHNVTDPTWSTDRKTKGF